MPEQTHASVKEFCLNYLKQYIAENSLAPGDKLPSTAALRGMMGVSLTSLREALSVLAAQGLIEIVNGSGIFVRSASLDIAVSSDVRENAQRLLEIFQVRKMIERQIIENAVLYADPEAVREARACAGQLVQLFEKGLSTAQEDKNFHAKFNRLGGNALLEQLAVSVMDSFYSIYPHDKGFNVIYDDTVPYHKRVMDAIARKDPATAIQNNNEMLDCICARVARLDRLARESAQR
jgi:DNA-binding FadR family transcriptional regulator